MENPYKREDVREAWEVGYDLAQRWGAGVADTATWQAFRRGWNDAEREQNERRHAEWLAAHSRV